MRNQKITVSVIGGHEITIEVEELAHKVGDIIARVGAILVCGGLGGVMEVASRGAKGAGGTTIGLLPGKEKVVSDLRKLAKDADTIYLATDLDREGVDTSIIWGNGGSGIT